MSKNRKTDIRCTVIPSKKSYCINFYGFEQDGNSDPFYSIIFYKQLFPSLVYAREWSEKNGYRLLKIEILF